LSVQRKTKPNKKLFKAKLKLEYYLGHKTFQLKYRESNILPVY
jgi:hypothetical protein